MGWRPRLNVMCTRCKKAHGPFDVCVSGSSRKRSLKPRLSFGKCPTCKKSYGAGGPLTHHCAPKSDFGRRKKQSEKERRQREREQARKNRPKHDYTECSDSQCKRSLCVAYKSGKDEGDQEGYARGWQQGYDRGFPDGQDACPRKHE
jgi:hypothetical protein